MEKLDGDGMGVLEACWERYARTQLAVGLNERELRLSHAAFQGGARSLYRLVNTASQLSGLQESFSGILDLLCLELNTDEDRLKKS